MGTFKDSTSQFIDRRRAAMRADWSATGIMIEEQKNESSVANVLQLWLEEHYDEQSASVLGGEILMFS